MKHPRKLVIPDYPTRHVTLMDLINKKESWRNDKRITYVVTHLNQSPPLWLLHKILVVNPDDQRSLHHSGGGEMDT